MFMKNTALDLVMIKLKQPSHTVSDQELRSHG